MKKQNVNEQQPKQESELKKWGRAGALMATGGLVVPIGGAIGLTTGIGIANAVSGKNKFDRKSEKLDAKIGSKYHTTYPDGTTSKVSRGSSIDEDVLIRPHKKALNKIDKIARKQGIKSKKFSDIGALAGALTGGALAGAGAYGAYRAGKAVVNKIRGKKQDKVAQYSLFSTHAVAQFGLIDAIKTRAKNDIKKVVDAGVNSPNTDDVVKKLLKSGEKAATQRGKVYGRYARKVWNTSPKLRRNLKFGGIAGAGLVGLNTLTGLKTVYDVSTGVKNKLTGKKREYSMFLNDVANFAEQRQDKSELERRSGKALLNKIRGKRKQEAKYNACDDAIASFKQMEEKPRKKGLLKKALKYGAIGTVGLAGLGAATRYGGAAANYRLAKMRNAKLSKSMKSSSLGEIIDSANIINRRGAKGQLNRDVNSVKNVFKRKITGIS